MVKKFQTGGLAALEEEDLEYGGALSQFEDPSQILLGMLTSSNTTTPEALEEARAILRERRERGNMPQAADIALSKMQDSAEQVREVLRQARERISAERFNPAEFWFAAASGLGAPTRTGAFGEQIGMVAENLRDPLRRKREFQHKKISDLLGIDQAMVTADQGVINAELQLAQLQQQLNNRLEVEAFKTLGRRVPAPGARTGIVPDSMRQLDSKYVEQYLNWTNTGKVEAEKSLSELAEAINLLQNSELVSGSLVGIVPKVARDVLFPRSGDVQDMVENSAAKLLRITLGSQFTAQEAANLLARTFNPRLTEETNAKRALRLFQALAAATENEDRKARYYAQHGTLAGFDGVLQFSLEDFAPETLERQEATEPSMVAPVQNVLNRVGITGESERPRVNFEDLSPEQQDEVRRQYQERTGQPPNFAKGGRVKRRYQEGGPVIVLPGGEEFEIQQAQVQRPGAGLLRPEEVQQPGAGLLRPEEEQSSIADIILGGGAGLGLEALGTRLLDPTTRTERSVLRTMEKDKIDPLAAIQELRRFERIGVPEQLREEVGPRGRALWRQALSHAPADRIQESLSRLDQLQSGHRERVAERVNQAFKPDEYFSQLGKLTENLYTRAKPLYEAAYKATPAVPQDELISKILATPAGKKAIEQALNLYRNQPGKSIGRADALGMVRKPSLEFYDYVKRGFDQLINKEEAQGPTQLGRAYRELRNAFRDRLDEIAGPLYKEAREQYAGDLEVLTALQEGREFYKLQPAELAALAQNMSWAEKDAYRTGIAQKLLEMINNPSSDINAAKKIIGSPAMVNRLAPFFDSTRERRLFTAALEKEAELFEKRKAAIRRGEDAVEKMADAEHGWTGLAQKVGSGFRAFFSPLGVPSAWILRIIADRPAMTQKEADRVLEILERSDPKEMAEFADRIRRSARIRGRFLARSGRRAGAAMLGAGAVMGGHELLEEEEVEE